MKTVVFDFDGVIHQYVSPWKGNTLILDPPVPGIKDEISRIRAAGYQVIVVSSRCMSANGGKAIKDWLSKYKIEVDGVMSSKPPALVYIDDRGYCFDGNPAGLLEYIENFVPWNRRK